MLMMNVVAKCHYELFRAWISAQAFRVGSIRLQDPSRIYGDEGSINAQLVFDSLM